MALLVRYQSQLELQSFKNRFGRIYLGIRVESLSALIYNAVFAVRRYQIVFVSVFFTAESPLSGFDREHHLEKILGFLSLQTVYLTYLHRVKPHDDPAFNRLELVNEYASCAFGYTMLLFCGIGSDLTYSDD